MKLHYADCTLQIYNYHKMSYEARKQIVIRERFHWDEKGQRRIEEREDLQRRRGRPEADRRRICCQLTERERERERSNEVMLQKNDTRELLVPMAQ